MRHILLALILVSPLALAEGPNIDKLNGAIRTESGKAYGDLETVNGAISVRADVEAEEVSTVNGSISIDERFRTSFSASMASLFLSMTMANSVGLLSTLMNNGTISNKRKNSMVIMEMNATPSSILAAFQRAFTCAGRSFACASA